MDQSLHNARRGILPGGEKRSRFLEAGAMGNKVVGTQRSVVEAIHHRVEVSCRGIPATHEGGFSFVKGRVAELYIALLKTDQHIPARMGEQAKRMIDGRKVSGGIDDDIRHPAACDLADSFL